MASAANENPLWKTAAGHDAKACGSRSFQRPRADSNRRIKVLQTSALPLGYGAVTSNIQKPTSFGPWALLPGSKRETGFEPATFTLAT